MVLLHALGVDSASWEAVRAAFDNSFRVVAIDARGHGESERPDTYSFELMRDDVIGVLDQLNLQQVTLVGHSMGGTVAYLVAQEQPNRFERFILEDTPPPYPMERAVSTRTRRPEPLPFDPAVLPAIAAQIANPDPAWWDRLADITAPTLLIAGGPSSHIPQEKLVEVAAALPTSTLVTIPVGHSVHQNSPAEFTTAITAFLRD